MDIFVPWGFVVCSLPWLFVVDGSFTVTSRTDTSSRHVWDVVVNKPTTIIHGGAAIVVIWISAIFIGIVNFVPLLFYSSGNAPYVGSSGCMGTPFGVGLYYPVRADGERCCET
ncbi:hypothetical protein M8C21_024906 [Ambrosia artemisiifolia]|uniref:Uncharacterized protein n=1 Tax=Ambrosia artemisiifolia TaxID=4212 RepID=A0AAD5D2V2_AMBAR|nr:hypothetical protein M8C21_024906 [Ambrosia artemisiifolia]